MFERLSLGVGSWALGVSVTIPALQQMKREGKKIVGVVVYDYAMAQIVDRAGVDIVSVGDSVGMNMWASRASSRSRWTR